MNRSSGNFRWISTVVAPCLQMLTLASARAAEELEISPPTRGKAFVVGGGHLPLSVRKKFVTLAGGPEAKILVVPTASELFSWTDEEEKERFLAPLKTAGAKNLHFLHAGTRKEANSEEFVAPMKSAAAIWFTGGNQKTLASIYSGTLMEVELVKLLNRGGVVGGTSAGAAVMSRLMIEGGTHPDEGRGFSIFTKFVIEQHYLERNRQERFGRLLTRHPKLGGIAIDRDTAIVFDLKTRTVLEVVGESKVHVYIPSSGTDTHDLVILEEGLPGLALP